MTIIKKSSYITSKDPSILTSSLTMKVYSNINSNSDVVDDKAQTYYEDMLQVYSNLKKEFQALGTLFTSAKKKATGEFATNLGKAAKACTNQGTYCGNRRSNLITYYRFATLSQEIENLNKLFEEQDAADAKNSSDSTAA